jgi:hypothetical protein
MPAGKVWGKYQNKFVHQRPSTTLVHINKRVGFNDASLNDFFESLHISEQVCLIMLRAWKTSGTTQVYTLSRHPHHSPNHWQVCLSIITRQLYRLAADHLP